MVYYVLLVGTSVFKGALFFLLAVATWCDGGCGFGADDFCVVALNGVLYVFGAGVGDLYCVAIQNLVKFIVFWEVLADKA